MTRQHQLLAGLLIIWGGALWYAWSIWPVEQHVPLRYVKGASFASQPVRATVASAGSTNDDLGGLVVQLGRYLKRPEPPSRIARDLFVSVESFRPKPKVTPPPPPPPAPPPPPPPTPEELAATQARKELAQFRYLGYLNKAGGNEVAFLSRAGELLTARRGETLQGRFYIKEVSAANVVIVETQTQIETTITLTADR